MDPGVPKGPGMTKSRELAYSVCSGHSARNGQKGRLGPPESSEKYGKAGNAGKQRKVTFLRVQGPSARVPEGLNRSALST